MGKRGGNTANSAKCRWDDKKRAKFEGNLEGEEWLRILAGTGFSRTQKESIFNNERAYEKGSTRIVVDDWGIFVYVHDPVNGFRRVAGASDALLDGQGKERYLRLGSGYLDLKSGKVMITRRHEE